MPLKYSNHELKKIFYLDILPILEEQESKKKSLRRVIWSGWGLVTLALVIVLYGYAQPGSSKLEFALRTVPLITLSPLAVIIFTIGQKKKNKYIANYKNKVIRKIFKSINPNLRYEPNGRILPISFSNSDIFKINGYATENEDLVHGEYNGHNFEFCEFYYPYNENGKRTITNEYQGIFLKAQINTKLNLNLLITPKSEEINYSETGFKYHKVKLESDQFHSNFKVYAKYEDHQIKARRFLTPNVMQKLEEYQSKIGFGFYLSIQSDMVYFYLPNNQNLFEPSFWFNVNYKDIQYVAYIMEILTEVLDHFDHIIKKQGVA